MWHDFERLGAHVALAVPVFFARVMLSKVHGTWHYIGGSLGKKGRQLAG